MRACARSIAVVGAFSLVAASLSAQRAPTDAPTGTTSRFPAGPGREALFKVCKDCHGPETAFAHLKTRREWTKTLDEMAANGATGTDEEWAAILEYLVKHASPVPINTVTAQELASMLDISSAAADAIVRARPILDYDALTRVSGVDPARMDVQKDRLIF